MERIFGDSSSDPTDHSSMREQELDRELTTEAEELDRVTRAAPTPENYEDSLFVPRGDNNQSESNPLSRLHEALAALGFPPSSINIESSQTEGTRLTINMPSSIEFETDSDPDEVSVTFAHRI
jgi:hypothetical protein